MIVYVNRSGGNLFLTPNKEATYQVLVPRLKTEQLSVNRMLFGKYTNLKPDNKEVTELKEFLVKSIKEIHYYNHSIIHSFKCINY